MSEINKSYIDNEYNSIDLYKFIMAIFVIAIHTRPLEKCTYTIIIFIYDIISVSAVPFFFITSGFFLFNKIDDYYNTNKINIYLNKIMKLYFIWTGIYIPLTIYGYILNGYNIFMSVGLFIRGFFFIGEHYRSWPLWYLLSLIISLIIIRMLLKQGVGVLRIYIISVIMFMLGNIINFLINNINAFHGKIYTILKLYIFLFNDGRLLTGMVYISMGMIIAKYRISFSRSIYILSIIIGILGKVFLPNILSSIGVLIYSVMIFLLVKSINLNNNKIYRAFRRASTVIYFTHMIFWSLYAIFVLDNPDHIGVDSFIITLMCTIVLSIIIIELEKKENFKWINKVF